MSTLSYQLGYRLGTLVAQVKRGMHSSMTEQTSVLDTAQPHHEDAQAQTPAMVRRGVDLNDWYGRNVTICSQPSPRKRIRSARKPKPLDSLS
jgi:hypothetical protein